MWEKLKPVIAKQDIGKWDRNGNVPLSRFDAPEWLGNQTSRMTGRIRGRLLVCLLM